MVKRVDNLERENDILDLIIKSYIAESKPISSSYLCKKHKLSYSTATVRNIMEALEEKGYLSHVHTSSGRVPTQSAFKHYVENLKEEDIIKNFPINLNLDFYSHNVDIEVVINSTLEVLSNLSGYTSLFAFLGKYERFFLKGIRFIFEQPEFEDIEKLKNLFFTLEVKIEQLQDLLLQYLCLDEHIKILVGDEIGLKEISDCSLVISGLRDRNISWALGLLGPMRMNYIKAISCLHAIKNKLKEVIVEYL